MKTWRGRSTGLLPMDWEHSQDVCYCSVTASPTPAGWPGGMPPSFIEPQIASATTGLAPVEP